MVYTKGVNFLINNFVSITKPGIIFGNIITVIGGFFLAARGQINLIILLATVGGIAFIIAGGCVFNNYIDRDIDKLMERTKNRVLAQGLLNPKVALVYAWVLSVIGVLILFYYTNYLTVIIALIGLLVYVLLYSLWLKRTAYGTMIGSISGAIPPLVGYCAIKNQIDGGAIILFLMLSLWQMPHSYAIAIFRYADYKAAGIPVLPVKRGINLAKRQMLIYVILFVLSTLLLFGLQYTGIYYLCGALILGIFWLKLSIQGLAAVNDSVWAKKMFAVSIIAVSLLSILMAVDYI
jgi:protoheme IX farnesyltransferase